MSPETKQQALAKLAAVMPKIGYPDKWRDYSSLAIRPDSYAAKRDAGRGVRGALSTVEAGTTGRSGGMGHDAADRERLLQPIDERNRLSRRYPAAPVL